MIDLLYVESQLVFTPELKPRTQTKLKFIGQITRTSMELSSC